MTKEKKKTFPPAVVPHRRTFVPTETQESAEVLPCKALQESLKHTYNRTTLLSKKRKKYIKQEKGD